MTNEPQRKIDAELLSGELVFTTSRSGGPGGQNVNKVNSKVTLQFDIENSLLLTPEEKMLLKEKLSSRITRLGVLVVTSQESRSQMENKDVVLEKFNKLLSKAYEKKKPRKATRPTKGSKQQRLKKKKVVSEKKQWRKKPDI